ncbi:PIR Superfamily Protein [Plasmodium ovale wallikeri]|uniref:PIR Superfamily Protein n=2 Tax=Plasmodium ovale TaxID=36330 RepID=A0A1A9ANV3_PLAOA|nr:PIR Superfamily Protein [Plasmodium ovale wallikeri]SBT57768.1 PIR Superfamily Protein [Plasmodium ovale wallikeri]SBT72624.1 Plasmodium vivax Vir protein, putative [Plasmodium ovale]
MESSEIDKLESSLGHLPAYEIYKTFEVQNDGQLCNTYFPELLQLPIQNSKITEFCNNIAGIVKYMSELSNENNFQEHCIYFNFYIYSLIKKKFSSFSHGDKESIIYAIYDKWTNISKTLLKDKCSFKLEFKDNNDLNNWIDMKCIYDYIKNYNSVSINYPTTQNLCNTYTAYISKVKSLYERYKHKCCTHDEYNCYYYNIDCSQIQDPSELLKQLKCNEIPNRDANLKEHETPVTPNAELSHGSNPETKEKIDSTNASTLGSFKTSMVVINPLIGTLLTFFFLYKFSPLQHWLRSKIPRNININSIPGKEECEESLAYTSEYADMNSNDNPYNISYQHI